MDDAHGGNVEAAVGGLVVLVLELGGEIDGHEDHGFEVAS